MKEVNKYIDEIFSPQDALLKEVMESIKENGMPSISVSPSSGKLLTMLVSMSKAKNVLEIGALGGYSGICLARGFTGEGKVTSLELQQSYAELAHRNLTKAGFGDQVTYMTGEALENLQLLIDSQKRFDFFFIDADKENYEKYLDLCLQLAELGAVIVADNVLAGGSVAGGTETRRHTETMKKFNTYVANHPKLESLLIPTGDGLTVSIVRK
ncbi:O-methyltransferase [Sporosarcina cascadiensis]|uniref:O-methyltransferase n=1 Tax=Sporosarcina cascadiensis TaxID=2660747 RepID=UPI00129A9364|nr:O-methyltransferase [Sporosarcina cascadiensis]